MSWLIGKLTWNKRVTNCNGPVLPVFNLRRVPRPTDPLPFRPRMSFIILLRLSFLKICTSKLCLLTMVGLPSHLWLSTLRRVGSRNTSVTASHPPRQGLSTWNLALFLSQQRCGPVWVTTGSRCLAQWDFHLSFWNSFLTATFWVPFGSFRPSHLVWGARCFGWAKEILLKPLMKGGEAGLGGPRAYFKGRNPQSGHKSSHDPPLPRTGMSLNWLRVFI